MQLFSNNKVFKEFHFDKESDFERAVVNGSKLFFGAKTIYIDAKRKIESKSIGNSIPDGFLFDLSDVSSPEFYIVEVELAKHDFYNHIFPQITKFFGFYRNHKSQAELVEKIFGFISNDPVLKDEFKSYLGEKEIYKFLKDTISNSQNILLVIDGEKKELPDIIDTYTDTWGKMVKLLLLKKFVNGDDVVYSMHPEFEDLEYGNIVDLPLKEINNTDYTEEEHLEGVSETILDVYRRLKQTVFQKYPNLVVNPTKWYVSFRKEKNIFFVKLSAKKLTIVVPQKLEITQAEIKNHLIKSLTENVQRFWFGNSSASSVVIESGNNLDEIESLLLKCVSKYY